MIISSTVCLLLTLGASFVDDKDAKRPTRPLTIEDVARLPLPGTTVPTAVAFTPDGSAFTYLLPERPGSTTRLLWRGSVKGGAPGVAARPPGGGDTDANVSKEEALRRERQRQRDTGITAVQRAVKVDLAVLPIAGDLYLQCGDGPLERLTNTPEPEIDPQLSPDGTKVAFVRGNELRVIHLADRREVTLSKGATEGLTHGLAEFMAQEEMGRSTGFWWSPDSASIAYQETDERHIPLFTIAHQGSEAPSVETHRYPFPGKANAKVRLGVVGVEGGTTRWLSIAEPDADFYLARVNWADPTNLLVQVLPRDQASLRVEKIDTENDRRQLLLEEKSASWINLHDDLRPLPGGDLLWVSERTGYRHIEVVKGDGSGRKAITSGDWPIDTIVGVDAKRREVWFSSGKADVTGMQVYRVGFDGGEPVLVTKEAGTHRVTVSGDGNHFIDTWSWIGQPAKTRLRDRDGQILGVIDDASNDPRLAEFSLTPPELVAFNSREGVSLRGAFYPPRKTTPGAKAPLIVLLYGGPHVQYVSDAWNLTADLKAQYLAQEGFAVWKMDNRGSARRGLAFESAIHRKMGGPEVDDQVDGVKFVGEKWKDLVDVSRVGVNGRSYGGYMTLRCLTEAPEVFHAGVAEAPVTDWDGYDTCYTERYMGTPENNPAGYKGASVLNRVSRLKGKLLIMHGLIDENVHFRHSARLVQALIEADRPFEILPVPEERHSSRKAANRRRETERLVRFFREALSPAP